MRDELDDLVGRRLGAYELREVVRRRRGSTTYRARSSDRDVDVSVLPSSPEPSLRQAGLAEVRRVARLQHPNILPIVDSGTQDEWVYFVTEHTSGWQTAADLRPPLPAVTVVRLLTPLLSALHYAHDLGIVHGDIAPRRIALPSPTWPMLTDFAVGRVALAAQAADRTGQGMVLGTPAYLAPEQAFGLPAEAPADVYSLSVVGYELCTGRVPFVADTPEAVLRLQAYEPPPRPRLLREDLPGAMENALLHGLAKDPSQRPTAPVLAEELHAAVAHDPEPGASASPAAATGSAVGGGGGLAVDYASAVQAFEEGRWDAAIALLTAVSDVDPGFEDVGALLHSARQALAQGED